MTSKSCKRQWQWATAVLLLVLGLAGCKLVPQTGGTAEAARAKSDAAAPAAGAAAPAANKPVSLHLPPMGLVLRDMTADERTARNIDHGVWVVVAVGASAIAGVREDDIILTVDAMPVRDVDSFWIQMDRANWQCRLGILRKGARIQVDIGKSA
jgi:S1-C subfamily serine protease